MSPNKLPAYPGMEAHHQKRPPGQSWPDRRGFAWHICPPDLGFPGTGALAEGRMNTPGWTYAGVDLDAIARARRNGRARNRRDRASQRPRDGQVTIERGR